MDEPDSLHHNGLNSMGLCLTNSIAIERRLAAILAADVEGYSCLMGTEGVGMLEGLTERAILDIAVEMQTALAYANASLPTVKRLT